MGENGPFPIFEWRRAVGVAAERVGVEAIAPFGFELTEAVRYLSAQLRYLFIYIARTPGLPERAQLVETVREALDEVLPEVARTIEIVDYDRSAIETGAADAWRTLVIRTVDAQPPLLRTWARYIVAAALAMNRTRITAVTDFHTDLMAQRYACQLAIMHDALFASLPGGAPSLTHVATIGEHLRELQRVSLADRYRHDLVDAAVVQRIGDAIERYYAELNARAGVSGATMPVPDFHGGTPLDFPEMLDALATTAMARYHAYAPPAVSRAATASATPR